MSLDPSYTLEECASMTMRQLRDRIDACHSARRAIPTRATDMAKGLVRDMATAAMAIKRGDA